MDIYKAILELRAEKQRLDRAIAALERKGEAEPAASGRKAWDAAARRAAAARMKKYWEQRRQAASGDYNESPPSTDSA